MSDLEIRYINSAGSIFPDVMFDEYSCPPDVRREVSHGKDEDGNKIWKELPDRPRPGIEVQRRSTGEDNFAPVPMFDSAVSDEVEDTRFVENFDTYLEPWASDRTSGGPSNFHGNAGGDDNPRDPRAEGESEGDYQAAFAEYAKQLPADA